MAAPLHNQPPLADDTPVVTVLITNYNGREILRDALGAVYQTGTGVPFDVVVIDDASTDESAAMVRREFPAVRLIVNESNMGFVRANNRGVREARGRYIFLLNSDTIVVNDAIAILSGYLDSHPEAGACGGWLLGRDGSAQVSFGSFPSFPQAMVDAFFLNDLFPRAGFPRRAMVPGEADTAPRRVDYISGADLMVRRSLVERLGLFDEQFVAYCEEVDLCHRILHIAGLETVFVPAARIIHLVGASYGKRVERQVRTQYTSYHLFLRKHYGLFLSLLTRLLYAWHFGVKLFARWIFFLAASPRAKEGRREQMLRAWYAVRYSLFPSTQNADH